MLKKKDEGRVTLSGAFTTYITFLAILVIIIWKGVPVLDNTTIAVLFLGTYFVGGYHLTKKVLPGIASWHPVYDTLWAVTSAKLSVFFFWPIVFAKVLFRLFIDRAL